MGELTKNHELEDALLCVDARKFRARIDWVRKGIPETSNAWVFLTGLADKNPVKFMSLVDEFSNEMFEWDAVDSILKSGTNQKIPAIRKYREYFRHIGLKEAKLAIEERMRYLRIVF